MTTGQRIKEARKSAGMTQRELGQKLGLSFQSVAQWESDLRNPKYETLLKIAVVLELPVSFFQGTAPFEDLEFLEKHKSIILLTLCKNGLYNATGKSLNDVGTYEFWQCVARNIVSIEQKDEHTLSFHYRVSPVDTEFDHIVEEETQNIYLDAIRRGMQKLNGAGQQRVADFAVDLADDLAKIPEYQRENTKKIPPQTEAQGSESVSDSDTE